MVQNSQIRKVVQLALDAAWRAWRQTNKNVNTWQLRRAGNFSLLSFVREEHVSRFVRKLALGEVNKLRFWWELFHTQNLSFLECLGLERNGGLQLSVYRQERLIPRFWHFCVMVKAGKLTSICLATDKLINCCSQSGYPFMVYGFEVSFVVQTQVSWFEAISCWKINAELLIILLRATTMTI